MKNCRRLLMPLCVFPVLAPCAVRADFAAWRNAVETGAVFPAATLFTPVHGLNPLVFDVGALGGPATYEFIVNAGDFGTSSALLGLLPLQGLKFEQNNNTGVFGLTAFGVADYVTEIGSILYSDIHVVYKTDGTDTQLYINGQLRHTFTGATITLSGPVGLGAARNGEGWVDRMDGHVLGFASYAEALSDAAILARSTAFAADRAPAPVVEAWKASVTAVGPVPVATYFDVVSGMAPVAVDVGEMVGPRSFEFVVNAGDVPTSSALLGRSSTQGLKFEQSFNTGALGVTDFGIADYNSGIVPPVNRICQVVYVYDGTDTLLYIDGEPAGAMAGVRLDLHRELGLGGVGSFAELFSYADRMNGSVLRFASYDSALSPAEIFTHSDAFAADGGAGTFTAWQAAATAGTAPAATLMVPVSGADPTTVDVGALTGDRSFEFIVNGGDVAGSSALMGNRKDGAGEGLKFEQSPNTGVLGLTKFGIADHNAAVSAPLNQDTHLVFTSDGVDTQLYVDGVLSHTFTGIPLDSEGVQGIAAIANAFTTLPAPTFFDRLAGHIFGFAAYNSALTPATITAHAKALFPAAATDGFVITAMSRNAATGEVTLTWTSTPDRTYLIRQSATLSGFTPAASVVGGAGATTTHTFTPTTPTASKLFFIVEEQP
ncbi:MAG: hypothetical protein JWL81_1803 [Verrucomicrobiales bacterium]|nr:hypothetical protein [Verrucomicrobiales bacterium]